LSLSNGFDSFSKGLHIMAKYIVSLTDEERALLQRMVSSGKGPARKLLHAQILLQADVDGLARSDDVTAEALQVGISTIHRVRQRFVEQSFESALVSVRPPARPDKVKITGDVERELIALACGDPPVGRCRWTLNLLATRIVELGYVDTALSRETVRKTLKKRHRPLPGEDLVYSTQGQRRLRLAYGGRSANVSTALRSTFSRSLHGRSQ
jgi:homeodomain-containing protein